MTTSNRAGIVGDNVTDMPEEFAFRGKEQFIRFKAVTANKAAKASREVVFPAFVTEFSDSYTPNFTGESVYGRMDEIQNYSNTVRSISLGWQVVSASYDKSVLNLNRCQKLAQMLYPSYSGNDISTPPIIELKFVNMIRSAETTRGLYGVIGSYTFTPDFEVGVFDRGAGMIYPKVIQCSVSFTPIHDHALGVNTSGTPKSGFENFPYGTDDAQVQAATQQIGASSLPIPSQTPLNDVGPVTNRGPLGPRQGGQGEGVGAESGQAPSRNSQGRSTGRIGTADNEITRSQGNR
jgi:hypothetical protein